MREYDSSSMPVENNLVYKDVVVIGNGPSGISLSYMLSGHWAYCNNKVSHPDELLNARLSYTSPDQSLMEQDLAYLADGLEGRSNNPVSLLLDSLQYPCADMGLDIPSMVEWRYHPEKEIDHIVLGKGKPGGAWHSMDQHVLTLSLGNWMSLPGLDYTTWEKLHAPTKNDLSALNYHSNGDIKTPDRTNGTDTIKKITKEDLNFKISDTSGIDYSLANKSIKKRAPVWRVAQYYEYYVNHMNLDRWFQNNVCVTDIRPICRDNNVQSDVSNSISNALWCVIGYDMITMKPFQYVCRNLVLASGASDLPNLLGIPGELSNNREWLLHDLTEFEKCLDKIPDAEKKDLAPVLIVGAGLCAADAVIAARSREIPVIHVFRNRFNGLEKQLPENMYPEYHIVHQMMRDTTAKYPLYTALPEHTLSAIQENSAFNGVFKRIPQSKHNPHTVKLVNLATNETKEVQVSFCAVLIGSRPDLRFVPDNFQNTGCILTNDNIFDEKINDNPIKNDVKNVKLTNKKNNLKINFIEKFFCRYCRHLQVSTDSFHKLSRESNHLELAGLGLGKHPNKPIDCRSNPIAVDKYTNRVLNAPPGLYAMGPLVGDNFVRFIVGGALAIVSDLHQNSKDKSCVQVK